MITYVPINLTNRHFYIGSTDNFERRWKEHLSRKTNYPFQNALRKNPENFFVLVSEDDGLETREEEQFYLDFYHGSEQCYNISSDATAPMQGRSHSDQTLQKLQQFTMTAEMIEKRKETWKKKYGGHPSSGKPGHWRDKKRPEHSSRMSGENNPMFGVRMCGEDNHAFGKKWWVNEEGQLKFEHNSPGQEWQNGKKWRN
jgi:group I intron endonuclease